MSHRGNTRVLFTGAPKKADEEEERLWWCQTRCAGWTCMWRPHWSSFAKRMPLESDEKRGEFFYCAQLTPPALSFALLKKNIKWCYGLRTPNLSKEIPPSRVLVSSLRIVTKHFNFIRRMYFFECFCAYLNIFSALVSDEITQKKGLTRTENIVLYSRVMVGQWVPPRLDVFFLIYEPSPISPGMIQNN